MRGTVEHVLCIATKFVKVTHAELEITWPTLPHTLATKEDISDIIYFLTIIMPLQKPQLVAAFVLCMGKMPWTIAHAAFSLGMSGMKVGVVKIMPISNNHPDEDLITSIKIYIITI